MTEVIKTRDDILQKIGDNEQEVKDIERGQRQNMYFPQLAADPLPNESPNGRVYYNTTTDTVRVMVAGTWQNL